MTAHTLPSPQLLLLLPSRLLVRSLPHAAAGTTAACWPSAGGLSSACKERASCDRMWCSWPAGGPVPAGAGCGAWRSTLLPGGRLCKEARCGCRATGGSLAAPQEDGGGSCVLHLLPNATCGRRRRRLLAGTVGGTRPVAAAWRLPGNLLPPVPSLPPCVLGTKAGRRGGITSGERSRLRSGPAVAAS